MKSNHILIVDDEPDFRKTLADILEARGYAPLTVGNGAEALDKIGKEIPVVALIDLKLEDMSGLELMKKIKEHQPGMECILLTGYASQESAIEAVNLGAYGYVQKPYDMEQLLVTVQRAIEKREAETALRESEEKYAQLFETISDAIVVFDAKTRRFIDVNESALRLYGYTRDEFLELVQADVTAELAESETPIEATLAGELNRVPLRYHRKKDGTVFPVEISAGVSVLDSRRVICGVIRDITERKRADEALRESEEQFRRLFEQSNDAIFIHTLAGDILDVNHQACEMLGYTRDQLLSRPISTLHPEDALPDTNEAIQTVKEKGAVRFESRFKKAGGQVIDVEISSSLIDPEKGIIQGIVRDTTERKQAEEALREAETRYRTVADFTYNWESWENPDGTLRYVSPACERITGYGANEFVDNPGLLFGLILPEDRKIWAEHRGDVEKIPRHHEVQFRIRRRSGEVRWLEHVCQPVTDEQGGFLGYRASNQDITIRKQAEEAWQDSVQKLRVAYEQASIYAQELKQKIAEHKQAEKEIRKLNEELEQRVADRTRELSALYDVTAVTSESLDLGVMLEMMLGRVLAAMRSRLGYIHLLDETEGRLGLVVHQGLSPDVVAQIDSLLVGSDLAGWVIDHSEPLLVPDLATDPRTSEAIKENSYAYAGVPMWARGQILGVLSVLGTVGEQFTVEEVSLLSSIADQVGVAVENARLRRQAEQAAILEERQRLARDLHDVVSQSLFSASVIAETLPRLRDHNPGAIQQNLADLHRLTRGALAEMRTLLMELRPAALAGADLGNLLHQLTEAIAGRTQMAVSLRVEGQHPSQAEVKTTLFRIAQEALNNIVKYARATQVTVSLNSRPDQVVLSVCDDGCGFEPNHVEPGHLGIGIMRERAEDIGATLKITSQPDQGTEVEVIWPRV